MAQFKGYAVVFAALGVIANLGLIALATASIVQSRSFHRNLLVNSKYYGRDVPASAIAALGRPMELWISGCALTVAAVFGILVAVYLLIAVAGMDRHPERSVRQLDRYIRLKVVGAVTTAFTFFWAGTAHFHFVSLATQHVSVGAGPPYFSTAILAVCSLWPLWWVWKGTFEACRVCLRQRGEGGTG